jgi:glycosyltransferase involved in cell wall biosynthesis
MRILVVVPYLDPVYGGPSKVVLERSQYLVKSGVAVDIVTTNAGSSFEHLPLVKDWQLKDQLRIRYFPCWHKNDLIFSKSLILWAIQHLKDYDIVQTHTVFCPLVSIVCLLCQLYKVPYSSSPHGMLEPWALNYKAWKKNIYLGLLEKQVLSRSSLILALTSTEVEQVKNVVNNRSLDSLVSPNCINLQSFIHLPNADIFHCKYPDTHGKKLILFLGRIDPKKGLDLLASAFAKTHQQFPQTHLVIAGPDSIGFLPRAKNYFQQLGCLSAVTFTGILTGEIKLAALSAADLFVVPSYSEGFSSSVLEGMAAGLPCIITTACNFPEAAAAKAAHVVDINSDAIANALIYCLSHIEETKAMGAKARQFITENYNWEEMSILTIKKYQSIIDNLA